MSMQPSSALTAVSASPSQPQTTVQAPGGPFVRYSEPGRRSLYSDTAAFGSTFNPPLVATEGYIARFRPTISVNTGSSTAAVVPTADAPYSVISNILAKDAFGNVLYSCGGYEGLYLVPKYSGCYGLDDASDIANMPSFVPMATALGSNSGQFSFSSALPLELSKGYGCISGANASLVPQIIWTVGGPGAIYSTPPTTLPTGVNFILDDDFYWLPLGNAIVPPGLGTTQQWVQQQCTPTFAANSPTKVAAPREGGYISTMILEIRDSNNNRVDAWPTTPSRLQVSIDGVPKTDSIMTEIFDDMFVAFGGSPANVRPAGVIALTRKTSLSQKNLGLLDTGECFLSTNPGTSIEAQGITWGSGGTPPYTLQALFGQVIPSAALIQGLPEV